MANKPGEANFFPDVPEFPSMGTFQPIYGKFDLTTYIQGASDYEIMAFLVGKYNACLEAYGTVTKLSTETVQAAHQLQDWINNWFDNLDVQEELNNKIDSMVQDGSFETLLHQTFDAQINQQTTSTVTAWLVANVTPTGSAVVVDKSLSVGGAAADAKATGDMVGELKEDLEGINKGISSTANEKVFSDYAISSMYSAFYQAPGLKVKRILLNPNTIYGVNQKTIIGLTNDGVPSIHNTIKKIDSNYFDSSDYSFAFINEKVNGNENFFVVYNAQPDFESKLSEAYLNTYMSNKFFEGVGIENSPTREMCYLSGETVVIYDSAVGLHYHIEPPFDIRVNFGKLSNYNDINGAFVINGEKPQLYNKTNEWLTGSQFTTYYLNETTTATRIGYRVITFESSTAPIDIFLSYKDVMDKNAFIVNNAARYPRWMKSNNYIYVASSTATEAEKGMADFVCDGVNDSKILTFAYNKLKYKGTLELSTGTFYIKSFTENPLGTNEDYVFFDYAPNDIGLVDKKIKGQGLRKTILRVEKETLDTLDDSKKYYIYLSNTLYGKVDFEGFKIDIENHDHPVIGIDMSGLGGGYLRDLELYSAPNNEEAVKKIPNQNSIGIISYGGDDSGHINTYNNIVVIGFYTAFKLGGEHTVLTNCNSRFNYVGFTFGDYRPRFGVNFSHPITLINCCSEHDAMIAKFVKCGDMTKPMTTPPLQEVTMISFNVERWNEWGTMSPCVEVVNGSFCGQIEFTANGIPTKGAEDFSAALNHVGTAFWAENSGKNFRTVNLAQKRIGTTDERKTYCPNIGQNFYDTTLNKELVCVDGYNEVWKDVNGNQVD